jgi:hypothetical protein
VGRADEVGAGSAPAADIAAAADEACAADRGVAGCLAAAFRPVETLMGQAPSSGLLAA